MHPTSLPRACAHVLVHELLVITFSQVVILPAFGASLEEMELLDSKDVTTVDTTCPWVSKVWTTVDKHQKSEVRRLVQTLCPPCVSTDAMRMKQCASLPLPSIVIAPLRRPNCSLASLPSSTSTAPLPFQTRALRHPLVHGQVQIMMPADVICMRRLTHDVVLHR